MRAARPWTCILLLVASIATANVGAQDCEITSSFEDCWPSQVMAQKRAEVIADETEDAVSRSETGIETLGANLGTTTKDFLTLLSATGLVGTSMEGDDTSGTFTVDLNSLLPDSWSHLGGKLQAVFQSEPKVYMPLQMLIAEDQRDARVKELEGDLSRTDNATLAFSINVQTLWLGRSFDRSYSAHYETMFNQAMGTIDESPSDQKLLDVTLAYPPRADGDACDEADFGKCTFEQVAEDTLPAGAERDEVVEKANEIRLLWLEAAALEEQFAAAYRQAVVDHRLGSFAALIANQPQLSFSLERSFKDPLVGPDEWALEARYEHPLAPNLNRLRQEAGDDVSLPDYRGYLVAHEDQLEDSGRLLLSVKYMDRESLDVQLPDLEKRFDGARAWEISAGWGKVLQRGGDAAALTRVDFVASWEDVSDDPDRQSRGLATLTVAHKFGNVTVPIGIVYSNKPEFLQMQEVDEELTAHVGLKFNLKGFEK